MSVAEIKFYDEKKAVVTNILDAAVKTLDFDQKSYIEAKAKLMQIIEKPGYEGLGLGEIVSITNKVIAKVAEHSGYVIVESPENNAGNTGNVANAELEADDAQGGEAATSAIRAKVIPSSVSRSSGVVDEKPKKQSLRGKEKLLQLMRLLPPLISRDDIEVYSAQIRNARLAPSTGASPPRTTGDFEKIVVNEVLETYTFEFDRLVREQPKAFVESVEMSSGRIRKVDISDKLRKQLARTGSVAEFFKP
ncbi:MAG: hypothetical protein A6F70_05425 [Cycloclasticus sp. symbiont of Bathymodiolus heckerae]|nr:MAG: hypothetical protein A6F70_05425 [Cycloclasticus sp. symbiont of Bathymodiolus heckerae]